MKLSSTLFCVCLKATTIYNCLFLLLLLILCQNLPEYWGIRTKIILYRDHWTVQIIQSFVAIKRNFSGLFFFWKSRSEGKIPFSQALTTNSKEYVKFISLMYHQFQPRPTLIAIYPMKTVIYLYSVIVNKCGERLALLMIHVIRFLF